MSSENVELIRRAYRLWSSDDTDAWLETFHPDFVFRPSGIWPGFDAEYRGPEGMLRFRDTMLEAWEELRLEPDRFEERGEWAIVDLHFVGKGRESGVEVAIEFVHVVRVGDGQAIEMYSAPDRDAAVRVAGLPAGGGEGLNPPG